MKVMLITDKLPPHFCGVGDHTDKVARELTSTGAEVIVLARVAEETTRPYRVIQTNQKWLAFNLLRITATINTENPDLIFLQWVPYLYSKRGLSLTVPILMLIQKLIYKRRVRLIVHDPCVGFEKWQDLLAGPIQRTALTLLGTSAEKVFVTIRPWQPLVARYARKQAEFVPAGATITPTNDSGRVTRKGEILVFSPFGSGKMPELIPPTWKILADADPELRLSIVGATKAQVAGAWPELLDSPRVCLHGKLSAQSISKLLQESALLLAPFSDGLSSRRSTIISALAHGLVPVSTSGASYDARLFETSPVKISKPAPKPLAAACASTLRELNAYDFGKDCKDFYQQHFNWPKICTALMT